MAGNTEFEKAFEAGLQRNQRAARDKAAEAKAARRIFNEGGYVKGADPRDFFNESDAVLCAGFVDLAKKNGMRGARLLRLSKLIQVAPPTTPSTYAKTQRVIGAAHGYVIGGSEQDSFLSPSSIRTWDKILLCQDGLLRVDSKNSWFLEGHREVVPGTVSEPESDGWDPEGMQNAGRTSREPSVIPMPLEKVLVGLAIKHGFQK